MIPSSAAIFCRTEGAAAGLATVFAPSARAAAPTRYDPAAKFELTVSELEYRRNAQGRSLMARVYWQPAGRARFRWCSTCMARALEHQGPPCRGAVRPRPGPVRRTALVLAVDLTLARQERYPACVQVARYALRWLKAKAKNWNGDATRIGLFGSSSGGHVAELLALRPNDARYNAIAFDEAPGLAASMDYVMTRSPISNTFARFQNPRPRPARWTACHQRAIRPSSSPGRPFTEANPQEIPGPQGRKVALKPFLIMQGALDSNMLPAFQTKFVQSYRAAGGSCDYTIFEGIASMNGWPSPARQTDRAHEMAKAFIARHVNI